LDHGGAGTLKYPEGRATQALNTRSLIKTSAGKARPRFTSCFLFFDFIQFHSAKKENAEKNIVNDKKRRTNKEKMKKRPT